MEAIFQPLFSLVGGVSDKSKALFMFGIWGFILCGLFYLVWNDPTMWPAKPDPSMYSHPWLWLAACPRFCHIFSCAC